MAGIVDILKSNGAAARLMAANCIVFVLLSVCFIIQKAGGTLPFSPELNLELAASFGVWLSHPWTLITFMFTHDNFLHLLFNMLWLLWFGRMFMATGNARRLVLLYFAGGLGGGLLYMSLFPLLPGLYGPLPLLLGASASVLAIMTATAVLMPDYTLHLFFIGEVKLKWMAVAMIALAFLGLGGGNAGGGIAHVGGVLTGLAAGWQMRRRPAAENHTHNVRRRNPFKGINREEAARLRTPGAHDAAARERADAVRLDELLDKIHTSGFKSLTKAEREELQTLSQKVTKP